MVTRDNVNRKRGQLWLTVEKCYADEKRHVSLHNKTYSNNVHTHIMKGLILLIWPVEDEIHPGGRSH